jgi:L-alanine-DL-glutamate epimerase-like enolase superfamily enzyme
MKITDLRVRAFDFSPAPAFAATCLPAPTTAHRITIVEIDTDEGITGIGSGGVLMSYASAARLFLVGQDPLAIERIFPTIRNIAYFVGRVWAVEVALWDIVGKAAGQPLYRLLGGARDRLRAYASTGELRPAERRVEDVQRLREEGFSAVKLRFHSPNPKDDLPILATVRRAVGEGMDIMVDANQAWTYPGDVVEHRWDLRTAIYMARAMEEHGVYWLEEPLYAYAYDELASLRREVNLRIAGGELNRGLEEFQVYMEKGCFDVYQPDSTFAGGITTARKVAAMAEARGLMFSPHTWTNGIGLMANAHLAAAVPNCPFIEFPYDPPAWTPETRDFLLTEPIRIDKEGYLRLPDKPGLGIELDPDKMKKYEAEV